MTYSFPLRRICFDTKCVGFNSWRRLGDVISSLIFLGYHEKIEPGPKTPVFLAELRKSAFARIYSDDKNVAVFLGRPPRLNRTFCHFQLPRDPPDFIKDRGNVQSENSDEDQAMFDQDEEITYTTGIRWTALCALQKERIIDLLHKGDDQGKESREEIA